MNSLPYTSVSYGNPEGTMLGITDEEIRSIVHTFYSKVRADDMLGPVFESEMSEPWDSHLEKMCNFWTSVMFAVPLYKGNPLEVHRGVNGIIPAHFERWLALFEQTLREVCSEESHVDAFLRRAKTMGRAMTAAIAANGRS